MAETSPIDPAAIDQLRDLNPDDGGEFVRELIGIFLEDTPKRFDEIRTALAAADAVSLSRAAHSIKGSAGNFGAKRLAAAAFGVEQSGKAADFAGARAQLPHLSAEYESVRAALERVLAGQ